MNYKPDYGVGQTHMSPLINMDTLRVFIKRAVEVLSGDEFDAIAFRGMSGALLATPVALAMKKTLILVRHLDDPSHSEEMVEGDCTARTYVILDDFIASGDTVRAIKEAVADWAPQAKYLGTLLAIGTEKYPPGQLHNA